MISRFRRTLYFGRKERCKLKQAEERKSAKLWSFLVATRIHSGSWLPVASPNKTKSASVDVYVVHKGSKICRGKDKKKNHLSITAIITSMSYPVIYATPLNLHCTTAQGSNVFTNMELSFYVRGVSRAVGRAPVPAPAVVLFLSLARCALRWSP